jgi:hypothetical protein
MADAPAPAPKKRRSRAPLYLFIFVAAVAGGATLYTWGTLSIAYARGERAGYVQTFSRKGWVCKTWEGELAMVNMPGATTEKFHFTAREPAVAEEINRLMGKRVRIAFSQHKFVPSSCFGETEYFAERVELIE